MGKFLSIHPKYNKEPTNDTRFKQKIYNLQNSIPVVTRNSSVGRATDCSSVNSRHLLVTGSIPVFERAELLVRNTRERHTLIERLAQPQSDEEQELGSTVGAGPRFRSYRPSCHPYMALTSGMADFPSFEALDEDVDGSTKKAVGYSWEQQFDKTWDQIQEDEAGYLRAVGAAESTLSHGTGQRTRIRDEITQPIRRGLIRFLILCIDLSRAMLDSSDMKPSKAEAVVQSTMKFVHDFFDQNPISQLCLVCIRDGVAEVVSRLSSSAASHAQALRRALDMSGCVGDASLQNGLRTGRKVLAPIPSYGTKEILVIFGALSSCDPSNVFEEIQALKRERIRVSIVGMSAEVFLLKHAAKSTGGEYQVALSETHLPILLSAHLVPHPSQAGPDQRQSGAMVRMGFPSLYSRERAKECFDDGMARQIGYCCPRCDAWLSSVPTDCVLCGLSLVLSPHLARSYHHLFPVAGFSEEAGRRERCEGCRAPRSRSGWFRCPRCQGVFCGGCEAFIHETLHCCPSCEVKSRGP